MSITISIRFLTGRAHLHPWQTHHSEGRVEWPPSQWRLLRALVAVAGRGLTSLPFPDFVADAGKKPKATKKTPTPVWPAEGYESLPDNWSGDATDKIPLSRLAGLLHSLMATPTIWLPKTAGGHTRQYFPIHSGGIVKNSGSAVFDTFATVRKDQPALFCWSKVDLSDQQLEDLQLLLVRMTYFGRAESWCRADAHTCPPGEIKAEGMSQIVPGTTHWECRCIEDQGKPDGREYRDYLLERRLAPATDENAAFDVDEAARLFCALKEPKKLQSSKEIKKFPQLKQHDWSFWSGRLEIQGEKLVATGRWTDNEIDQLASHFTEKDEKKLICDLMTKCNKPQVEFEDWRKAFEQSAAEKLFLRCLLRESGQDIKDGLERPIGTRWVHYAVPRTIYHVPRAKPHPRPRTAESVDLVRYALNTATVGRAVLPAVTDTLLVADKFRSAVLAIFGDITGKRKPCDKDSYLPDEEFPRAICGHERDGKPCQGNDHAYWWPVDEDNDGFIDHLMVYAPGKFQRREVDALRRLTRLRQRDGRPDLLVTPTYAGLTENYPLWQSGNPEDGARVFVSATPYFCPVHLSHGRGKSGRIRSLKAEVTKSLRLNGQIDADDDVFDISEIVFDFAADELSSVHRAIKSESLTEPVPPRQYFPVIEAPNEFPPLPGNTSVTDFRYRNAVLKDADGGYCFGNAIGLSIDNGSRFVRAMSFCRRRRGHELRGRGRMLQIAFSEPRSRQPFAIGSQSHFGIGLFVPASESVGK